MPELLQAAERVERAEYVKRARPAAISSFAGALVSVAGFIPQVWQDWVPKINSGLFGVSFDAWTQLLSTLFVAIGAAFWLWAATTRWANDALHEARDHFTEQALDYQRWLTDQGDQVIVELARSYSADDPIGGLVTAEADRRGLQLYPGSDHHRIHIRA